MTLYENYVVYPEGGCQEIPRGLAIDELVDLNGIALKFPLPSPRIVAYRVYKVRHSEERGMAAAYHYLELVPARDLLAYT
jgi:hypothetical protein